MIRARRSSPVGLSLLEVTLAAVVGLILLAGSVAGVRQYQAQARISTCKMHMAALRQAIGFYKFRTGFWPQLYPGGAKADKDTRYVTWMSEVPTAPTSGQSSVVVSALPGTGKLPIGSHLVLSDDAGTVWARTISEATTTTLTFTPPLARSMSGTVTVRLAGLFANRDDSGKPLLDVAVPPGDTVWGNGLGDRWTAVADVKDWDDVKSRWSTAKGWFLYEDPASDWGGLAYEASRGELHYYLPSEGDTDGEVGNFSGDPPYTWGR